MNSAEVWEPWQPKVGQRVRVRLSAECNMEYSPETRGVRVSKHPVFGHPDVLDGMVGKVISVGLYSNHHPYSVHFMDRYEWLDELWCCHSFAAIELEPVEWPSRPA